MAEPRYVIIHGHFYQPPRESPWTGLIGPEPGAAPFHNWNERILSECYLANAQAQVMEGTVIHVRNNYEAINFDLGPTLGAWLERHGRSAYRSIQRGDSISRGRRSTHGNAIAQGYSHSILPLLPARSRELEIAWGIEDFVYRFGRTPEGIWLPECAADEDTLASVAAAGLKFVILAPEQGVFRGPGADSRAAGPFLWKNGDFSLAVFRYDRELAGTISFGDGLKDGAQLAEWIRATAAAFQPDAALAIATDGETFGHHKRHGAAELARTIIALERCDDVIITNCAEYLEQHPPAGSFEINGATSWSCPHGVERWRADCGCRSDSHTTQAWRAPLREAMDFVRSHAEAVYERFAATVVKGDAFAALKRGIRVLIDSEPSAHAAFFAQFKVDADPDRERLLRMLEMVRAGHAALTSCGWFFDDFGGPEGRIVLKWAARAVELAAELAPTVEPEMLDRLREIRSNRRDVQDAATLYLSIKTREARGRV